MPRVLRKIVDKVRSGGPRSPYMLILDCGHRIQYRSLPWQGRETNWRSCPKCVRGEPRPTDG